MIISQFATTCSAQETNQTPQNQTQISHLMHTMTAILLEYGTKNSQIYAIHAYHAQDL
jgi:hypothetical protein